MRPRTTRATRSASPATDGVSMFQRIFATALGAGIGVGLLLAALQHATVVPLILEAEKYESGALQVHRHAQGSPPPAAVRAAGLGDIVDALPRLVGDAQ